MLFGGPPKLSTCRDIQGHGSPLSCTYASRQGPSPSCVPSLLSTGSAHLLNKYLWKGWREERKERGGKSRVLCPSTCRKELLLEPWRCTASGWYAHLGLEDVKGGAEQKAQDVHTTCTSSCGTKEKPDSCTLSPSIHRHCHEEADTPRTC